MNRDIFENIIMIIMGMLIAGLIYMGSHLDIHIERPKKPKVTKPKNTKVASQKKTSYYKKSTYKKTPAPKRYPKYHDYIEAAWDELK